MSPLSANLIHTVKQVHLVPAFPRAVQQQLACDNAAYCQAVSDYFGLPALSLPILEAWTVRLDLLPYAKALAYQCLLFENEEAELWLVLGNPFDALPRHWALQQLQRPYQTAVAHYEDISAYLEKHEASYRGEGETLENDDPLQKEENVTRLSLDVITQDRNPVVRRLNLTLYDALKANASDVHLESTATGLVIKYRIDGVLLHADTFPGREVAEQAISRVKVLSELDISERRIPQDGRFKIRMRGRDIDFRVSIMPSIFGEDAVLRVLDKQGIDDTQSLRLDMLGYDDSTIAQIRRLASEPYGLLLVTGPTGSGKSTTLYATLSEINTGEEKIITIEDPVEYQLAGVLQIPVNDKKGLSFARGLRSILRHDPDKILVGEIRDSETANIAVQAALTGHLVLTSVHANSVFSVLDRFIHIGVEPHSLVDALIGMVAQRLIRKICPVCTVEDQPNEALLQASGLSTAQVASWSFRRGTGCDQCRHTGYLGRKAIAEVLHLDDASKEAILRHASLSELKQLSRASGYRPIRELAIQAVARGETTLQEINRVTLVD